MTTEDIKAFNQRLSADDAVRTVFESFGLSDVDGVRAYAAQLGYVFTEQDLIAVATELSVLDNELTDEQLEAVAGGAMRTTDMLSDSDARDIGVAIFAKVVKRSCS